MRFLLVLSSLAPLFLLWAIKGVRLIPDYYFISVSLALAILPTLVLFLREWLSRKQRHLKTLTIGKSEDQRNHILVYLFAILLPFYRQDIGSWRELIAVIVALLFIVFLFWYLNLHYMNILFAARRYHIFAVYPSEQDTSYARRRGYVLITRRSNLTVGESIVAFRLANDLYMEKNS